MSMTKQMFRKWLVAVLLLGMCVSAGAGLYTDSSFPNRSYFPLTPEGLTPVTGYEGQTLVVNIGTNVNLPNSSTFYGITGIGIREHGDRPCEVKLFGGPLDSTAGPDNRLLGTAKLDRCDLGAGTIDYKGVAFDSADRADNRLFLSSAKACTASTFIWFNRKLKGLEIFHANVNDNGTVVVQSGSRKFERSHCRDWNHPQVSCGNGRVATGVVMHHAGDSFIGIALKCADVKSGRTRPLVRDNTGF